MASPVSIYPRDDTLRKIYGMRNHLVHGYEMLDVEIAWDAIETCMPPLQAFCEERFRP